MKKMTQNKPIFEQDKQQKPLEGEVPVKDARLRVVLFAAQEKMLIKKKSNK